MASLSDGRGRKITFGGHPLRVTLAGPGVAPAQVGTLVPGTQGVTTLPVSYTAPATGTAPITYQGFTSLHGAGTWISNSGTFTATGGTFIGLLGNTSYDLRIVATNAYGSSTRDYLTGDTTATTGSWTNGLTATRYDVVPSASSGAPASARTVTAYPNGAWPSSGTVTLNDGSGGTATITVSGGSSDPASGTYTPASAGEKTLTPSNSMSLANPLAPRYTCMTAASGAAQTIANNLAVTALPNGRIIQRSLQGFQRGVPVGNPNGFSTGYNRGWGAVWLPLTLGGATSGLFLKLYDAESTGATTTPGSGTLIQDVAQVAGALSGGSQIVRVLLPAGVKLYFADVSTDAAFTNAVRIPWSFYVGDIEADMVRSQESSLLTNFNAGTILPSSEYLLDTTTTGISNWESLADDSATDSLFATSWAPTPGTSAGVFRSGDGGYYVMNSPAIMTEGHLFTLQKGVRLGKVGLAVVDGSRATFADMIGTDGTPCVGFRDGVISQCGGEFRYLRTNCNDGGGPLSYGTAGCRTALNGLVSYFATHFPACAVMSLGLRSGNGTDSSPDCVGEVGAVIREEMEATDGRVAYGDVIYAWDGFYNGHPNFASQWRIAIGVWQSLMGNEVPIWGGFGLSFADRWPRMRSTGTRPTGSHVLRIPVDLPAGATALHACRVHWNGSGIDYSYPDADANDLISITYVFGGGATLTLSSVAVDNGVSPPELVITVDSSVTMPSGNLTVWFGTNTNSNPYTPVANWGDDVHESAAIFDNTDRSAFGINYGKIVTPKLGVTVSEV